MSIHQTKKEKEGDDRDLFYQECLDKAEGDELRALAMYNYKKTEPNLTKAQDLDQREKWPMLVPLLILYTIGTIGVLALVFGFLANRLNWW